MPLFTKLVCSRWQNIGLIFLRPGPETRKINFALSSPLDFTLGYTYSCFKKGCRTKALKEVKEFWVVLVGVSVWPEGKIMTSCIRRYFALEHRTSSRHYRVRFDASTAGLATRIISNSRKCDHTTPVLQELRWLPESYYLMYTVGVLAF